MRIAIIGGGMTGLTAAYKCSQSGHRVTVYEQAPVLGGLAHGFRLPHWKWSLEYAYHHYFTNDDAIISLMEALGMHDDMLVLNPTTSTYTQGSMYQLDSPASLLSFQPLSPTSRIRTGLLLAACNLNPFWQPLESLTATELFPTLGGNQAWNVLWEPLLSGKFGPHAQEISAAWLWARVKKRTPRLGYIRGGFQALIERLADACRDHGTVIHTSTPVSRVTQTSSSFTVTVEGKTKQFDRVLLTVPTPIAARIAPDLPEDYIAPLTSIDHLHAQVLILTTPVPILPDDIYWLNINDRSFPFLAAVSHTNFISPAFYGGDHITYFGNYLPLDHPYLSYSKQKLLKTFEPFIRKISRGAQLKIQDSFLFTGPFAQPVHTRLYSRRSPALQTPIPYLYLANMDSIYPWDRGTNYAVELGDKAAARMMEEEK